MAGVLVSLFFKRAASLPDFEIPKNSASSRVAPREAMNHSVVWAAARLRADLISSLPVDVFRRVGGVRVEVAPPPVLVEPGALVIGGQKSTIDEWLYATQVDLDRYGNCFGKVVEWDSLYRPARIDLVSADRVAVREEAGRVTYRIDGVWFEPEEVWHERQYVVAGLPVGLSPVAHAALSISEGLTAKDFARSWFSGTNRPAAILKNSEQVVNGDEASKIKERYNASVANGDLFVTGRDWTYEMSSAPASTVSFIEASNSSDSDVARFMGVPGDVIDVATNGSNITYANVTQRHLQLLVIHMGPSIQRRERALSQLTPRPRFVKLNSDALLRMDPAGTAEVMRLQTDARLLTNAEGRALLDRQPLTDDDKQEFADLFGNPNKTPTQGSAK